MSVDDAHAWARCPKEDLWVYDKLILGKMLGHKCGPVGMNVPEPAFYIVRPITNILGMGRAAKRVWIDRETDNLTPGYFWCEEFIGAHLSIDYKFTEPILSVMGIRDSSNPLWKWDKWVRSERVISYPTVLKDLIHHPEINCEFVGGHLIEVHLRHSHDMGDYDEIVPHWKGEFRDLALQGYTFYPDPDYNRVGFWKRKYE